MRFYDTQSVILQPRLCGSVMTPQQVVVSITMIENTDRVFFTVLLTIFRYNFEAAGSFIPHINCDWHPESRSHKY